MAKEIVLNYKIRELRLCTDEMSLKELARKAGVSRQTIITIEAGNYSPSLKLAFSIANVFGIEITEVFIYAVKGTNKNMHQYKNKYVIGCLK